MDATSNASEGQRFWLSATRPSKSSISVARVLGVVAHAHQRIRLFAAGRVDAARPVVFEAARDQVHAVGEQRRGERVAAIASVGDAVEA